MDPDASAGTEGEELKTEAREGPGEPSLPSVHQLEPLEAGGTVASGGLDYQDHVAVGFCVDMLHESRLLAVWCDYLDDITLIWEHAGDEHAEFVQVKGTKPKSLWSVASLTARSEGRVGTSLLERSLAHDRCREETRFRIVTLENVAAELRPLEASRETADRQPGTEAFDQLLMKIEGQLDALRSPRGRGAAYWLAQTEWHVRGVGEAVRDRAQLRLNAFLWPMYEIGAPDHQEAVYDFLLSLAQRARIAAAEHLSPEAKKLKRPVILNAVRERIAILRHPTPTSGGGRLRQSLRQIGVSDVDVDSIVQQHLEYLDDQQRGAFISRFDHSVVYTALERRLRNLRVARAAGDLVLTPLLFYMRCLAEIRELHESLPDESRPELSQLEGMMYEMVNRAVHFFGEAPSGVAA